MSYKLDTSNPEIKEKVLDVLSTSATDWVHLGYDGSSTTKLKVVATGSDGFDEMLEQLNEGKVQYYYVRFSQGANLYKYVYIAYVGEGASGMLRGNSHNHTIDMSNFLKTIRAPIHVQVNARSEVDLNEDKIQKQLKGAMGANYDAGAKVQGQTGGVKNVGEGVKLHKEAQEDSNKYEKRALPFIPDNDTRQQFWNKHNTDAARNKGQASNQVIDEQERKKFWEQQQKEEAERKAKSTASSSQVSSAGTSNLTKQFDNIAIQQAATPAVQGTGKKWTPPPASNTQPSKPPPQHVSKPPPVSAPPPVSSPPPTYGAPPPTHSAPPPVSAPPPTHSAPPPVSAPPPTYGAPPPTHSAPPPVSAPPPTYGAPPPTHSAPPPVSAPPPTYGAPPPVSAPPPTYGAPPPPVSSPPPAHEEDNWDDPQPPEPEPQPQPPSSDHGASAEYPTVTALFPFEAEQPTDLSFNEGDLILVLDKTDPSGWWRGRDQYGNEGYFPMNFVQN